MFEVKTLLPQFDINLPTCMYTMKNVALTGDACGEATADASVVNGASYSIGPTSQTTITTSKSPECVLNLDILASDIDKLLKSSAEIGAIKDRQEKVFKQLNDLKEQLANIRKTLGTCQKGPQQTKVTQTKTRNNGGLRDEPLHDIVINGHPNFIPYALLALKNAWKDLFTIDVRTFTHSTMADIGPEAKAFEKSLKDVKVDESKPKISVTLIWKNCEHTEMISSPTMYVPIYGEVNIIRYLGRVGPEEYRYENSDKCNEMDAVLDICYQLLRCTTNKTKAAMINALSNRLQRRIFFGGDQISIADIGVHSSLKRMKAINNKDLTSCLKAWHQRVAPITLL